MEDAKSDDDGGKRAKYSLPSGDVANDFGLLEDAGMSDDVKDDDEDDAAFDLTS